MMGARIARVALAGLLILASLGPLSAARYSGGGRVRVVVPPVIGHGDGLVLGVQLSADLQAYLRQGQCRLELKLQGRPGGIQASRLRGNEAPRDSTGDPFEACFSTKGLESGAVIVGAEATVPSGHRRTPLSLTP